MDVKSYHHYRSPHQKHKLNGTKKGLKFSYKNLIFNPFVPRAGIEPALLAELDFESSASTNSATWAYVKTYHDLVSECKVTVFIQFSNVYVNFLLKLYYHGKNTD